MRVIEKVAPSSAVDQVALKLREWILRQGLEPGDRVPPYRELAELLGVSYVTVKRGVDALVRNGTVKCVDRQGLYVAEGVCWKPQALRVALIGFPSSMPHVFSHLYASDMARGILSTLDPGVRTHIRFMPADGLIWGDYVDARGVDAVILPGVENDEYLRMAAKWGRQVVVLDYCSETVPIDFVACDNRAAARRCVEHLAGLGHRQIAYLRAPEVSIVDVAGSAGECLVQRSSDARERREWVMAAAADLGLPAPRVIGIGDSTKLATKSSGGDRSETVANQQALTMKLLAEVFRSRSDRPTALVLDSELEAPGVMRRLAEMGLRVPEDVSVCAVAGAGGMSDYPQLTYCRFNFYRMGQKAVEILRERFARPEEPVNRIHRIGFEWVEGSTCGGA